MKLFALFLFAALLAAQSYTPTPENLKAREWFQDARFGMFIHWGVYSVLEDGEWVMNVRKMPVSEYEKLPAQFNPTKFNAAAWVSLAKAAGMKYITITSKHHDGFAMFATRQNKWNIVDVTPYKKDPLKELAAECQKQGIKLFFYHSQLDWHHRDYFPRGRTGQTTGRPESGDFNRYPTSWTRNSPSCSPTMAPSRASGSTACGTSPARTGVSIKPTASSTNSSPPPSLAATIT